MTRELGRFATFAELRRSDAYRAREAELKRLLNEPKVYRSTDARPRLKSFLRVVEWNIERGARLEGIIEALNSHPLLRYADLLLLNELDCGMVRSGNCNVALELSRALEAHAVYGVEYLEFTKGTGDELHLPGENTAALHGNAILTRYPIFNPQIVRLPRCENNFESDEKRLGGRAGILIDVELAGKKLLAVTAHLDVVNTPRCRAKQMRALLEAAEARVNSNRQSSAGQAVIVGGDFNTHTFARGGKLRSTRNTLLILSSGQQNISRRLLNPQSKEPVLSCLAQFGYEVDALNDHSATSRGIVSNLDDSKRVPGLIKWWVKRRVPPQGLLLEFRLDWFAARGLRALKAGELIDRATGAASVDPQTIHGLAHAGAPLSDHDPIVVDLSINN